MATGTITKVMNDSNTGYCKMPDGTLICWGEFTTNRSQYSVTANGAMYAATATVNISFAKEFISQWIFKYIDQERVFFEDYKSALKEYGDAKELLIEYRILKEYGVPHDKTFIIACLIDGQEMGVGRGKNKKEAEQSAAKGAMRKLRLGRN